MDSFSMLNRLRSVDPGTPRSQSRPAHSVALRLDGRSSSLQIVCSNPKTPDTDLFQSSRNSGRWP